LWQFAGLFCPAETYDFSMESVWTPRREGDAGELSAMNWLVSAGAIVCKPLFENPDYDLIADFGDRLDPSRCDSVFVHAGDGRRWYIGAAELGGCSGILLGGPRYAAHEIESGEPLEARPPPQVRATG
jgi:hypothetical protein